MKFDCYDNAWVLQTICSQNGLQCKEALYKEVLDMLRGEHFVVQNKVNKLLTNVVNRYLSITQFKELVV